MKTLADAVLPLTRTRSDLYRYSAGSEKSADVNALIADLRKTHRRQRLQQEFDRAGLPRAPES